MLYLILFALMEINNIVLGSGQKDKYEKELESLGSWGSSSTKEDGKFSIKKIRGLIKSFFFFSLRDINILLVLLCYLYKQFEYGECESVVVWESKAQRQQWKQCWKAGRKMCLKNGFKKLHRDFKRQQWQSCFSRRCHLLPCEAALFQNLGCEGKGAPISAERNCLVSRPCVTCCACKNSWHRD